MDKLQKTIRMALKAFSFAALTMTPSFADEAPRTVINPDNGVAAIINGLQNHTSSYTDRIIAPEETCADDEIRLRTNQASEHVDEVTGKTLGQTVCRRFIPRFNG